MATFLPSGKIAVLVVTKKIPTTSGTEKQYLR